MQTEIQFSTKLQHHSAADALRPTIKTPHFMLAQWSHNIKMNTDWRHLYGAIIYIGIKKDWPHRELGCLREVHISAPQHLSTSLFCNSFVQTATWDHCFQIDPLWRAQFSVNIALCLHFDALLPELLFTTSSNTIKKKTDLGMASMCYHCIPASSQKRHLAENHFSPI